MGRLITDAIGAFWRRQHGATAVEFAAVSSLFFLLVLGVLQFGIAMWTQTALNYAVTQAARCYSVGASSCGTASATATYASSAATGLNIPASSFTATTPTCGHQVVASYPLQFVMSGLFPYTPTLSASSCYP